MKDKPLFFTSLFFMLLLVLFIIIVFTPLKEMMSPLITALALVYFLSSPVKFAKKLKINSTFAVLAVYGAVIALLALAVVFAVPKIESAVLRVWDTIGMFFEKNGLEKVGFDIFGGQAGRVYTTIMSAAKNLFSLFVGAVAAFYILADVDRVKTGLRELMPLSCMPSVKVLCDDVKYCLDSFFKGQVLIAAILFVIDAIFLYALQIPYAAGLGFIAAALDIVPYIGAFVGMGLILTVTAVSVPEKLLIVVIGLLIIQQIENHVITPKVSADTLQIHPSVTVLVLYLGAFGGFWGILLAVPITCIFKKICMRIIQSII